METSYENISILLRTKKICNYLSISYSFKTVKLSIMKYKLTCLIDTFCRHHHYCYYFRYYTVSYKAFMVL